MNPNDVQVGLAEVCWAAFNMKSNIVYYEDVILCQCWTSNIDDELSIVVAIGGAIDDVVDDERLLVKADHQIDGVCFTIMQSMAKRGATCEWWCAGVLAAKASSINTDLIHELKTKSLLEVEAADPIEVVLVVLNSTLGNPFIWMLVN